jgi:hypothetical protein
MQRLHGKRYRYYISSRLKGAKRLDSTAWRVPASELESIAIKFVANILADRKQLIDWIGTYTSSTDLRQCVERVAELRDRFASGTAADQRPLLHHVLQSITLGSETITFEVNAAKLMAMLQAEKPTGIESAEDCGDGGEHLDSLVSIQLPVTMKRCGNEMRLVLNGDDNGRAPDPRMVSLIARAHLYPQQLTRAPGISVSDVAK